MKLPKKILKLIFFLLFIFSNSVLLTGFYAYNTKGNKPFREKISRQTIAKKYKRIEYRRKNKIDDKIYYWKKEQLNIRSFKTGKIIFTCDTTIKDILYITYTPQYGTMIIAETYNKKQLFISMKTGLPITKLGRYYKISPIQKYRKKYIFRVATSWNDFHYVNVATGKMIKKWGSFSYLGKLNKINNRYFFDVSKNNKQFFIDADSAKIVGGKFSATDKTIFKVGNRHFFKAHIKYNYYYVDLLSGEKIFGPFKRIGKIQQVKNNFFFKAYKNKFWSYYNAKTGQQLPGKYKRLQKIIKIGNRYLFYARENRKQILVDILSNKKYGKNYKRIKNFQYAAGKYFYYAKLKNGLWTIIEADSNRRIGGKFTSLSRKTFKAGKNYYLHGRRKNKKTVFINLRNQKVLTKNFSGYIYKLQYVNGRAFFKQSLKRQVFYVDLKTGKPIGGKYKSISKIIHLGKKAYFRAKLGSNRHCLIGLKTGKRKWGIYNYLYEGVIKIGKYQVLQVNNNKRRYFISTKTGKALWGNQYKSVRYNRRNNFPFFLAQGFKDNKYFYVSTKTGKPIGGKFDNIFWVKRIGNKLIFKASRNRKYLLIDTKTGKRLWDIYSRIGKPKEYGKVLISSVRKGKGKSSKEYYLNLNSGRPWGGIFNKVKPIKNNKGLFSFLAKTGEDWKAIFPFKSIDYTGMKFSLKKNKFYPSQMNLKNKNKRIIGSVTLNNPFKETITIKLELESMDFPSFYGKKSSIISSKITIKPNATVKNVIVLPFSDKFWELNKSKIINSQLSANIKTTSGRTGKQTINLNFTIASRDRIKWDDIRNIAPFANTDDKTIKELAGVVKSINSLKNYQVSPTISIPLKAYEVCRSLGLNYSFMSLGLGDEDTIKLPFEVIKDRLGKCTDTTILYATLLSKLGYSTIITTYTYKRGNRKISHLMLLIDTGVNSKHYRFLHKDKKMLVIPPGMKNCYIPIETTGIVSSGNKSCSFLKAWKKGIFQYRNHSKQILEPKNTFRLQSAWQGGFSQISPDNRSKFKFPKYKKNRLKETVRELLHRYSKKMLENKKEEKQLKKQLKKNNYRSQMAMGKYYYEVRRYYDGLSYFKRAAQLKRGKLAPLYYQLSVLVYIKASEDPRISYRLGKKVRGDFNKVITKFSKLLYKQTSNSKKLIDYAMNYDISKWFNAFSSNRAKGKLHKQLAHKIMQRINKSKATVYSAFYKRRLTKKGFSPKSIKLFQQRGFSARTILKMSIKGFSEETLLSFATKGFSEDTLLSFATKGFSEDTLLSFATKGFSEDTLISFATKGSAEESWSLSH